MAFRRAVAARGRSGRVMSRKAEVKGRLAYITPWLGHKSRGYAPLHAYALRNVLEEISIVGHSKGRSVGQSGLVHTGSGFRICSN